MNTHLARDIPLNAVLPGYSVHPLSLVLALPV